jgi:hypothetical protein
MGLGPRAFILRRFELVYEDDEIEGSLKDEWMDV